MPEGLKYLLDAAVGAALFFALMMVFAVDYFFFATKISAPTENTLTNVNVIEDKRRDAKKLKLAVTKTKEEKDPFTKKISKYDDMGKLLDGLGAGYRYDELSEADFIRKHEENKLREYDVVFLTCNKSPDVTKLKDPLQKYVAEGGILYASDLRYNAVALAFDQMVVPNLQGDGAAGAIHADIVDSELRDALGDAKIHLQFDLPEWKTAAFGGPAVKTLITGKYRKDRSNDTATAPLMVKFQFNKGTVIFTSFHNEKQNSAIEKKLLEYVVFSLVTAGLDTEISAKMEEGGFTPQRSNLLSTPKRNESDEKKYTNTKVCTLRFVLGFQNVGAKLRFNIKSPDGKEFTKDCESTVALEVANAAGGTWTYTVTTLDAPYENIPFKTFVGEKK